MFDRLRPLWKAAKPEGKLAAPRLGRSAVAHNRRIAVYAGSHSLAETAERFGQNRRSMRLQLKAARRYRDLGIRPISCRR